MAQIRVAIINVTGYIGVDLARLLLQHPDVQLCCVTGRSLAGKPLSEVFPHLASSNLLIQPELDASVDFVFSAMPHNASADIVEPLVKQGLKVIDVSADFRLKDQQEYETWYGARHPCPQLLASAVYGLPELHRAEIAEAQLVANPGCYPTGAILALAPAIASGMTEGDIIVDSKSGVSGAGRSLTLTTHYAECNESVAAYAVAGHRHMPEIRQECMLLNSKVQHVVFQPHLVPMTRGILSTCYLRLSQDWLRGMDDPGQTVVQAYRDFYESAPFVRVVDVPPATKQVWGSNYCHVFPRFDSTTGRLLVISCIDNLVKGGAGQAVQNMNLMCGFDETSGLHELPVYP
jgi:N-acetyl-gamma-glutamyl-phosphate reductase